MTKIFLCISVLALQLSVSTTANAATLLVTLDSGTQVQLQQDYCRDPVTGHIGPCWMIPQARADQDLCYDPVYKTWGPCYSAARFDSATEDACRDPVTGMLGPCL
jgi:hypothetical protein